LGKNKCSDNLLDAFKRVKNVTNQLSCLAIIHKTFSHFMQKFLHMLMFHQWFMLLILILIRYNTSKLIQTIILS
jgi:hypothetical protein